CRINLYSVYQTYTKLKTSTKMKFFTLVAALLVALLVVSPLADAFLKKALLGGALLGGGALAGGALLGGGLLAGGLAGRSFGHGGGYGVAVPTPVYYSAPRPVYVPQ